MSGGSDDIINEMGDQLGFPPGVTELFEKMIGNNARILLSDSQTSLEVNFESAGLHNFFKHALRCIAKADTMDEAMLW